MGIIRDGVELSEFCGAITKLLVALAPCGFLLAATEERAVVALGVVTFIVGAALGLYRAVNRSERSRRSAWNPLASSLALPELFCPATFADFPTPNQTEKSLLSQVPRERPVPNAREVKFVNALHITIAKLIDRLAVTLQP
jgi:hypothetical protein